MPETLACPEKVWTFCLYIVHFDTCELLFLLCLCLLTVWFAREVRCCICTSRFPLEEAPKGRAQLLQCLHL